MPRLARTHWTQDLLKEGKTATEVLQEAEAWKAELQQQQQQQQQEGPEQVPRTQQPEQQLTLQQQPEQQQQLPQQLGQGAGSGPQLPGPAPWPAGPGPGLPHSSSSQDPFGLDEQQWQWEEQRRRRLQQHSTPLRGRRTPLSRVHLLPVTACGPLESLAAKVRVGAARCRAGAVAWPRLPEWWALFFFSWLPASGAARACNAIIVIHNLDCLNGGRSCLASIA